MDGFLTELSDQLAPSQDFIRHADEVMNKLFKKLQSDSKYKIDRLGPEGGVEKKTSLGYSVDYDVTAFVNNEFPPFAKVLDDFQDIILKNVDVEEKDMKMTKHSVQFTLEGVDFDLLAATNLAPAHQRGSAQEKQFEAMLRQIKMSTNKRKAATDNSAGLTETAVKFVKQQTTFVHKVARLAKFWNSTIFYTEYLNGRSSIFELLGIDAGREEEKLNQSNPSILRALRLFLKRVENIQNQKVIFDVFYRRSDIPGDVLSQTPLLLDPSNPYNNFMNGFEPSVQKLFSGYARESLKRLEIVENQVLLNHGYPNFRSLFLPQPKPIEAGPNIGFKMPTNWLVTMEDRTKHLQPNLIVRKASLGNDKFVLGFIKKILASFLFVSDLEVKHKKVDRKEFVKDRIKEVIDELFYGTRRAWSGFGSNHKDYDVTFEIPVGREGGLTLVVSFKST